MRAVLGAMILAATGIFDQVQGAEAITCNPADFLKPENITHVTDDYTRLALIEYASSMKHDQKKTKIINDTYSAYGVSNQSYDTTQKFSEHTKKSLNLDYTQSQKEW